MKRKSITFRALIGLGLLALNPLFTAPAHGDSVSDCAVPAIFNFTPLVGTNGTEVKISGTNFSATVSSNIVYFGAVQAAVLSANPTNLVVTVPVGATYAPVTVTVNGLAAYSSISFLPTFSGQVPLGLASLSGPVNLSSGDGPACVAVGDLDGDGKPDVVVANVYDGAIWIYRNISTNGVLSASSFAPPVIFTIGGGMDSTRGLALADLTGDGRLDIVVANRSFNMVSIFQNFCSPGNINNNSFGTRVDLPVAGMPYCVAVMDLDGDGKPEIITTDSASERVSVLKNIGASGTITTNSFSAPIDFAVGFSPVHMAVADLDGDGKPDVVTINYGNNDSAVSVLRNISTVGNIAFAPAVNFPGLSSSLDVAIGDLDGDGKPDLAVSSFDNGQAVSIYRNTSISGSITTNSFAPPVDFDVGGWGNTVAMGDLDGDGKLDVVVLTQLPDHLSLFRNISTVGSITADSFAPRVDYPTGWNPNGMAIGDLDGDGRPDITFGISYAMTLSIYQNQTPFSGPPVITMPPTNETAVEGASTVLSVAATGAVPLAYQWSFNGATLPGATNATLTLTNLHSNQAGNYQVRVANAYGAVTSSAAVVTVAVQSLLVYTYSGTEEVTTSNLQFSYKYSGQMFFIPAGTNGTFIGWGVVNGKKQFWVSPFADYQLIRIPGSANRTYTVLGKAGENVDAGNNPHLWSYLHRGQNEMLTIASRQKFSFPETFTCNDIHVYPDAQTGKMILREAASTYTFSPQSTQTANNNGKTMIDLVNALTQTLVRQGYKQQ
jgi:hypothetical protein